MLTIDKLRFRISDVILQFCFAGSIGKIRENIFTLCYFVSLKNIKNTFTASVLLNHASARLERADAKSTPSYSSDLHFWEFQNRPDREAYVRKYVQKKYREMYVQGIRGGVFSIPPRKEGIQNEIKIEQAWLKTCDLGQIK